MSSIRPARTADRRTRSIVPAAVLLVGAALIGVGFESRAVQSPAPSLRSLAASSSSPSATSTVAAATSARHAHDRLPLDHDGAPGEADGVVADDVTIFDDEVPAVVNLDPALLGALRQAATDAADDGVEFYVNSGWRSPAYQEQLLREAISKYGSKEEASRWVATPETSEHVSGDAADIGHHDAAAWLSDHGADYGLCQIYRNEPWHYELRPEVIDHGCPAMYADPTHDPRMHH